MQESAFKVKEKNFLLLDKSHQYRLLKLCIFCINKTSRLVLLCIRVAKKGILISYQWSCNCLLYKKQKLVGNGPRQQKYRDLNVLQKDDVVHNVSIANAYCNYVATNKRCLHHVRINLLFILKYCKANQVGDEHCSLVSATRLLPSLN
ncbi:hypothetical protein CMV_013886 [Castanea mollissima]|uniref:Uncharacterized protein n=1 Tax=Castanea mollissima TaxID=60419 RepID=A0A8J4VV33_9ROSI|nr:hypothetical protein CMV_013886 [Castanea mollissima]